MELAYPSSRSRKVREKNPLCHAGAPPAFVVERAAYPLLGCKGYGVHVNGYVVDERGKFEALWVALRPRREHARFSGASERTREHCSHERRLVSWNFTFEKESPQDRTFSL